MSDLVSELPTKASVAIRYRAALASDSRSIARFVCLAGGGLYEFLFDDFIPFMTAVDFLAIGIAGDQYPISYRNCHVAVDAREGGLVGAANVFPADLLQEQSYALLPDERQDHIRPMLQLQDWGSMFLNALAVNDDCRGQGVGARLLAWAEQRAKDARLDRLSLHVWADNAGALGFYRARGFVELGVAAVAEHPRLLHRGGSMLMSKKIATI
jgi:GNAT superfamily N-acetyltransferase